MGDAVRTAVNDPLAATHDQSMVEDQRDGRIKARIRRSRNAVTSERRPRPRRYARPPDTGRRRSQ